MRRLVMLPVALLALLSVLLPVAGPTTPAASAGQTSAPAAKPRVHPWGKTRAPDQRIRKGCHGYRYSYKITAPTDDWLFELFLVDPKGKKVGSAAGISGTDKAKDTRTFRLCQPVPRVGRYTIRMKVTWYDFRDQTSGRAPSSTFRLTPRR